MKKYIFMILGTLPFSAMAQRANFSIGATVDGLSQPAKVYLSYRTAEREFIDSTTTKDGSFQFQGTIEEPVFARIFLDHELKGLNSRSDQSDGKSIYLVAGKITIDGNDSLKYASVTSPPKLNDEFYRYTLLTESAAKNLEKARLLYRKASENEPKDNVYLDSLRQQQQSLDKILIDIQTKFVREHTASFLSLDILKELFAGPADVKLIDSLFQGLDKEIKNTPSGIAFAKSISLKKQ